MWGEERKQEKRGQSSIDCICINRCSCFKPSVTPPAHKKTKNKDGPNRKRKEAISRVERACPAMRHRRKLLNLTVPKATPQLVRFVICTNYGSISGTTVGRQEIMMLFSSVGHQYNRLNKTLEVMKSLWLCSLQWHRH